MSSLTVSNTFANGSTADAPQVNTNFTDVKTFVDTHAVHKNETALEAKSGSPGNKFQFGRNTINATDGQTETDTTITFDVAFTTAPKVVVQQFDAASNSYVFRVQSTSTTNFVVAWRKPDNSAFGANATTQIDWIAIGT